MNIKLSKLRVQDERKQKKILAGLFILLIVLGVSGKFFTGGNQSSNKAKAVASKEKVATQEQKQNKPVQTESAVKSGVTGHVDIAQIYPFIDSSKNIVATNSTNLPTVSNNSGAMGLPAIPTSQPVPNLGNISLPPIPGTVSNTVLPSGNNISVKNKQNSVQGVLTSENGKNMAIMSDGKIVQEGDSYGGQQIAYITGDGIHFDNGNSISYGIK